MDRTALLAQLHTSGTVERETVKAFANGSQEVRIRKADGTFVRLDFPDTDAHSLPIAIQVSTADGTRSPDVASAFAAAFGVPDWKSSDGQRQLWHARPGGEDLVTPAPGAAFVAELQLAADLPPSYTIALPAWFAPKGN